MLNATLLTQTLRVFESISRLKELQHTSRTNHDRGYFPLTINVDPPLPTYDGRCMSHDVVVSFTGILHGFSPCVLFLVQSIGTPLYATLHTPRLLPVSYIAI